MDIATFELFGYLCLGEMIGAMFLVMIGNSISCMTNFKGTSGFHGSWLFNNMGWGMGDALGILFSIIIEAMGTTLVEKQTGINIDMAYGLINPAFSTAMFTGGIWASNVGWYGAMIMLVFCILAQIIGAIIGQLIVDTMFWKHFKSSDLMTIKSVHCTSSNDRDAWFTNMFTQFVGAGCIISVGVIVCGFETKSIGSNLWIPFVLGMTLMVTRAATGSTAFASNPARDLGPRLVFALLPLEKYGIDKKEQLKQIDPLYTFLVPFLAPMLAGIFVGAWCWLVPEFHIWYEDSKYAKNPTLIFKLPVINDVW